MLADQTQHAVATHGRNKQTQQTQMPDMILLKPADYGPAVAALLPLDQLNDLGPGTPRLAYRAALEQLTPGQLLPGKSLRDHDAARACLAGLWLLHDFLAESHAISQDLHTADGSYWHGIMHRREPDDDNAKYWFRRVGNHAIFPELLAVARQLASDQPGHEPLQPLLQSDRWHADRFIDLCSAARRQPSATTLLCQKIQQAEWELLFRKGVASG